MDRPDCPAVGAAPAMAAPPGPAWRGVDVFVAAGGLVALIEHLRGRSNYATVPLLALVAPAILLATSPGYRRRARGWAAGLGDRLARYSAGSGPIPWAAALVLVVAPAWLLDLSNGRTLGAVDTQPVVPTAVSLLTQGDCELGECFFPGSRSSLIDARGGVNPGVRYEPGGGFYSSYPVGMVPFAAAVAALAGGLDADLGDDIVQVRLQKMTAAFVAAGCVGLSFLILLTIAPPGPAWLAAALLAAGSGLFSTVGMALWQHGGVIFWSSIALLIEFRSGGRPTARGAAAQGACCALMLTCRLTAASWLVPFGIWVAARDVRRASVVVGVAGLAYLPWAVFYLRVYGHPFGPSMGFAADRLWSDAALTPLLGVLASPARGLLVYQPWVALATLAVVPACRRAGRSGPPGWAGFCWAAIGAHLALISAWGCWWGGWCWGSRLVVEVVPLAALLAVGPIAALSRSRAGLALVIVLGLLGATSQAPGVYGDPLAWNRQARLPDDLWSWRGAPFLR